MTDTDFAMPGPLPPPPQRARHGCLWGCLIAAAIAITAFAGAISYFGWFLNSGYKNNSTLHAVMSVVNADPIARSVLGDNIRITSLEGTGFSADTRTGKRESYAAHVQGSRGEGRLSVTVETQGGMNRITSMVLTGPDGNTYDLTSSRPHIPPDSI